MRPLPILAVALGLTLVAGCATRDPYRAELRIDSPRILRETPRFAFVDDFRVSTLPEPIPAHLEPELRQGLVDAAAQRGLVHDPAAPLLLVLLYREFAAPRRGDYHPVRVDWRYGERSGTYDYLLARRGYPDLRVGILVCDVVDLESGDLVRQLVDPDYFYLAKLWARRETDVLPAAYAFPVGVLAARSDPRYHPQGGEAQTAP